MQWRCDRYISRMTWTYSTACMSTAQHANRIVYNICTIWMESYMNLTVQHLCNQGRVMDVLYVYHICMPYIIYKTRM